MEPDVRNLPTSQAIAVDRVFSATPTLAAAVLAEYTLFRGPLDMWIVRYLVASLATLGCILAQERSSAPPAESRKSDTVRRNRLQNPCSIPLVEIPIPTDRHFFIKKIRPSKDKVVPMPKVKAPAPSCADRK
jgi:hypothetical protein